ncbi:hypothetical protein TTHERM_00933110 (macronuclear) [Tetrahymena thermophila SB210]|uniref:Uncharacterized protein n=1 Tax=Tetrahymena thermophila (strain SB210) TaxID=312017 RepID=I7M9G4_TETTS|nr:hypothetical protein TTHERM_00933110 [Tetrahymena thermophila SB210]EAS01622.1 hypothetical protein TTHERM_00933110 [Tetrahymena thermophila SB210]|eukprot:XP_001021867.1 hypothetical protein TTHERM_00933110 [Tetrahymena thermophila SB210]
MNQTIHNIYNNMQNNINDIEFQKQKQEQSRFLTQKQTDPNITQATDCKLENIYQKQDIMNQVCNDQLQQDQLNNNKQNQINSQIIQKDKQGRQNNQIQSFLQNFEDSLNGDYSKMVQNIQSQKSFDNDKISDNISGSDFEKKCQIRNDLKQVSKQMNESLINQKLTSSQFLSQDKSFLFKKTSVSQKEIDVSKNNQILGNNIMNSNPYQVVNVGLSKVALKNKLNPSMLKKFQNVGEQQEDYLVQLFDDESPKNDQRQVFNFSDKNIDVNVQDQIQNEEIKQFILNGHITQTYQQSEQQKQTRKKLESQIINILQNLKTSNNQKLITLLSCIDDDNDQDYDNNLDYKMQIRQKYLQQ